LKILIADDENISRLVLQAALKKRRHEVLAVENGRKAWEAYQNTTFPC
jgi:two-component system cell cycle response regulator